jgi:4a-hydroxytetrahydrobiopterin dehydratase
MDTAQIDETLKQVPEWNLVLKGEVPTLQRAFRFKNFVQALAFANKIGQCAEEQYHHPTLVIDWGRVHVTWVTHKINGLHMNDFAMAAQTDALFDAS